MQAGMGFMVLDANQEKIATILYEYEQTKKELALKRAEAARLGQLLISIGSTLNQNPAYVKFLGEPVPMPYSSANMGAAFNVEDLDGGKIKALTAEIRELEIKLNRLATGRNNLGYPV